MMALRGERIPSHDVLVRTKERREVWVNMSTVLLPARRKDPLVLLHLFRDANQQKARDRFFEQLVAGVAKLATAGEPNPPGAPPLGSPPTDLTPREREVLRPLASGASNRAIADKLGISPATARNHVHNVLTKLRVQSRTEAVSLALRNGLT
jgi:DNA-binding NarL/FixJ family response regulator